ncbi:MAG: hypothetical protein AB8F74_03145 [Saprospiraceae bacterium]
MSIAIIRLLFDFGLLILIWMTQLVVYPSFTFFQKKNLLAWHSKYTQRITVVVLPLMLGQLLISVFQLWEIVSWYTIISFVVILVLWAFTFLHFIPLHNKIAKDQFDDALLKRLVDRNWIRTFFWTVLFIISSIELLKEFR